MTEYVTPIITSVLKNYQNSAPKSLQGPGHALVVAAAAAAAAASVNCPLDATLTSSDLRSQSPLPNGKLATNAPGQLVAASLIKKEIPSSPEPHEMRLDNSPVGVAGVPGDVAGNGTGAQLQAQSGAVTAPPPPPPQIYPPPPPELSQPILSVADSGSGELYETPLEGKTIGCFSLGGEMRLCLPQFLNTVLNDFSLEQINRIFDELGIYCSQCTPDQLVEFKAAKILPSDVKASGLITRTDAERLCAALLHRSDRNSYIPVENLAKGALSFHVYHKCFGKCEGICTPDMYSYQKPTCIKCLECDGWFSPQKFVGHVHRKFENRTCHWGFDSRNWHDYLHVALDVENRDKYQRILDQLKEVELKEMHKAQRELDQKKRKAEMLLEDAVLGPLGLAPPPPGSYQALPASLKHHHRGELLDIPTKKHKPGLDVPVAAAYPQLELQRYQQLMYAHCMQQQQQQQQQQQHNQRVGQQISAFRPWGAGKSFLHAYNAAALSTLPYGCQEPPELQNPERVVRSSDRERFERTYQPNVALAPRKSILSKERDKDRERERMEREREREMERQRREKEHLRERELQHHQQQHQQHPHQHHHHHPHALHAAHHELHIKQERSNTPLGSPPTAAAAVAATNGSHNGVALDEEAPLISPIAAVQKQQQQQQQSRHSVNACSSSSPTGHSSSSSKPVPAHLPPPPPSHHLQPAQPQPLPQKRCHLPPAAALHIRSTRSPDEFCGGSNEITSSTSPVPPAANKQPQHPQATQPHPQQQQQQQQHIIATVNQHAKLLPSSNSYSSASNGHHQPHNNGSGSGNGTGNGTGSGTTNSHNEAPSRIRINKNLMSHHHHPQQQQATSITPPLALPPPPPANAHQQSHHSGYFKSQQAAQAAPPPPSSSVQPHAHHQQAAHLYRQHSPTQSSSAGLNLSTHSSNVVSNTNSNSSASSSHSNANSCKQPIQQPLQNGNKPHLGSEFELSTDTDDDSLNGEPDSSNMLPPWEMAVEALRETRPRDRERVLHLLQRLLQENQQYRYNNVQLSELVHKQDAHIAELREQLQLSRRELDSVLRAQQRNGGVGSLPLDAASDVASESGSCSRSSSGCPGEALDCKAKLLDVTRCHKPEGEQSRAQADAEAEAEGDEAELRVPLKRQALEQEPEEEDEELDEEEEELNGAESDETMTDDTNNNNGRPAAKPQSNGLRRSPTPLNCCEDSVQQPASKRLKSETQAELEADTMELDSELQNEHSQSSTQPDEENSVAEDKHAIANATADDSEAEVEAAKRQSKAMDSQTPAEAGNKLNGEESLSPREQLRFGAKNETEAEAEASAEESNAEQSEEEDDEEDLEDDDAASEELQRRPDQVQAPHSSALATPPTATTPISPDSAATAGQLFDSSNSSDESSMKKAQMSASNALAKMSADNTEKRRQRRRTAYEDDNDADDDDDDEDEETEADADAEAEEEAAHNDAVRGERKQSGTDRKLETNDEEDDDDDEVPLKQRQQQHQRRRAATGAGLHKQRQMEKERRHSSPLTNTALPAASAAGATALPTATVMPLATNVPQAAPAPGAVGALPPRTLTLATKASKKQTPPTTNCELQIKKEIV